MALWQVYFYEIYFFKDTALKDVYSNVLLVIDELFPARICFMVI